MACIGDLANVTGAVRGTSVGESIGVVLWDAAEAGRKTGSLGEGSCSSMKGTGTRFIDVARETDTLRGNSSWISCRAAS